MSNYLLCLVTSIYLRRLFWNYNCNMAWVDLCYFNLLDVQLYVFVLRHWYWGFKDQTNCYCAKHVCIKGTTDIEYYGPITSSWKWVDRSSLIISAWTRNTMSEDLYMSLQMNFLMIYMQVIRSIQCHQFRRVLLVWSFDATYVKLLEKMWYRNLCCNGWIERGRNKIKLDILPSCHVVSCHVIPCHVMPCHVMYYLDQFIVYVYTETLFRSWWPKAMGVAQTWILIYWRTRFFIIGVFREFTLPVIYTRHVLSGFLSVWFIAVYPGIPT